jgi:hypothetical protein
MKHHRHCGHPTGEHSEKMPHEVGKVPHNSLDKGYFTLRHIKSPKKI